MRRIAVIAVSVLVVGHAASAELQNVDVGGRVVMRSRTWVNSLFRPRQLRIPDFFLSGRAIGPFGTVSQYRWDDRGSNLDFIELDTRINVRADFTRDVAAFVELESFDLFGQDPRSDYRTGFDSAARTSDDVEVLYSYIDADEPWGYPLRLRIGRQPLKFGREWLVSERSNGIRGMAFDGVRLTYAASAWEIDVWWSVIAEETAAEQDGDVTFAGLHGTYTGFEGHELSGFWFWVRDPRTLNDTNFIAPLEWAEDLLNLDDYDPTNLHTVGIRAVGAFGGLDYALDAAYQFGEFDQWGFGFKPYIYGDDGANVSEYAFDLELGYTIETAWAPRVYLGGAYFSGEDNRDGGFIDWLNPFDRPEASSSFNRLYSQTGYNGLFDNRKDTTNFWQARAGVEASPTENLSARFELAKYGVVDTFDLPIFLQAGEFRVPVAPALPFLTEKSDDDMGWMASVDLRYAYSEELTFRFIYEYLFTGEALEDGNFQPAHGLEFNGGSDRDNAQYIELRAELKF